MQEEIRGQLKNKKAMGYMCSYVPVELISAAGLVPYRLTGDARSSTEAYSYLPTTCCSFSRSVLERALRGEFSFLAGVVIPQTCDNMREAYDIWHEYTEFSFYHRLSVPMRVTGAVAEEYFTAELERMAAALGALGRPITDGDLQEAIRLHNRVRLLLCELAEMRASVPLRLTGRQFIEILLDVSRMAPESAVAYLEQIIKAPPLEQAEKCSIRLMLVGSLVDNPDLVSLMDEGRRTVVSDDFCYGRRAFEFQVEEGQTPLAALARGYLQKIPCPCKYPGHSRWEHILDEVRKKQADGVVMMLQKFCDTHRFDQPDLEAWLAGRGVPALVLEVENQTTAEAISTRIQAFTEMLIDRKERGGMSV